MAISPMSDPAPLLSLEDDLCTVFDSATAQLSCVGQDLDHVPFNLADEYGRKTLRLDLSHNAIHVLNDIEEFTCLEELYLDNNQLSDDFVLPDLHGLKTLSLNKNRILDLNRLLGMLRKSCPSLTYLSLIGNAACPNGMIWGSSDDDYSKYRQTVVSSMPSLLFLDSTAVTSYERQATDSDSSSLITKLKSKIFPSQRDENLPESVDHSTTTMPFYDSSQAKLSVFGVPISRHGVHAIAPLADKWIVTCGSDGVLKVFDLTPGAWQYKCVAILKGHRTRVRTVTCFPDVRVVSGSDDRSVRVWDLAAQLCLKTLRGHSGAITSVVTLSDGRIASASEDGTVRIWDISRVSLKPSATENSWVLRGHSGSVNCLCEGHSATILSGSSDETIKLWNHRSRTCLMTLVGRSSVTSIALLADDQIAAGGTDCVVNVWTVPQGRYYSNRFVDPQHHREMHEPTLSLRGHRSAITAVVALDPERIITSSADKLLAVWNLSTARCETVLSGHNDPVTAVIRLADGRLASSSSDIKLWDLTQPDKQGSRIALTARFNIRNDRHRRSIALNLNTSSIWTGVRSIFAKDCDIGAAPPAYPTLTTAYPSTINIFATNFAASDDETIDKDSDQLTHMMSVLFAKGDESPLNELKLRIQDWKLKLRRKKGPNVADWFGIMQGKRIREGMQRLTSLIDEAGETRLTYHRIKERLIDEFGEDLFDQIKEQVTMELAMRDFMLAGGRGMANEQHSDVDLTPSKSAKKNPRYFPETTTPIKPSVARGDMDPVGDYSSPTDEIDTSFEDDSVISMNTSLMELFSDIAEHGSILSESERKLGTQLDDLTADFESGRARPTAKYETDCDSDWIIEAMKMSTLWREDLMNELETEEKQTIDEVDETNQLHETNQGEILPDFDVDRFSFKNPIWV